MQTAKTRIGEIAILGLNCEALTDIGMAIKAASPFKCAFVITNCNGWQGYLPPGNRYNEGGYQVGMSGFGPEASDMVIKTSAKLLNTLR